MMMRSLLPLSLLSSPRTTTMVMRSLLPRRLFRSCCFQRHRRPLHRTSRNSSLTEHTPSPEPGFRTLVGNVLSSCAIARSILQSVQELHARIGPRRQILTSGNETPARKHAMRTSEKRKRRFNSHAHGVRTTLAGAIHEAESSDYWYSPVQYG